ncbi:MAG: restriction endonuclease subunit S [Thermodesulfobacteriota bacterium]|nr:restriction endonuclease subunit S [Thermodesulfobacteriota bacterium]
MSTVEFGSLFEFVRNGMNIRQDKSGEGLPITRIETISESVVDGGKVGYAGLEEKDCVKWLLQDGDILFSHINSVDHIGKCAVYRGQPNKLVHGMNLLCLRPDTDKLDPEFGKYLIRNQGFRSRLSSYVNKAVNQASISIGNLRGIPVPLPPLPEQRRIAAILDKADAIRRKRQQAIHLTEEFLRSVFLDMFGDPVTNPKGWEVKPIGELTFIDAPMVDPREERYQNLLHIGPDRIEKVTGRLLPAKSAKEDGLISGKFLFDERYVLYSKIRPLLRKVALPNFSALCSADVYPVRPNTEVMTKEFLWYVLLSDSFLNYTQTLSSRANIPKINRKEFSAYPCYLPPLPMQIEFSKRLVATSDMQNKLSVNEKETESLFNSLIQRAFRGDL